MKTLLIALLLIALIPTASARPLPGLGDCTYTPTTDGVIVRCIGEDGKTTLFVAKGSCLAGFYVYAGGLRAWGNCPP